MPRQKRREAEVLQFLVREARDEIERPQYVQDPLDALARGFPRISRDSASIYLGDLVINGAIMLYYDGREIIGAQVLKKELASTDQETNALERIRQALLQYKRTPQNGGNAMVHSFDFKKVMRSANVQQVPFYIHLRKLEEAGLIRIHQEINARGLPSKRIQFLELMPELLNE